MIGFFSNIFGYVLNVIYFLVQNYGLAIILFTVLVKLVLLPMSIKQQKTMKKSQKIQVKVKEVQDKYKSNPEKMNQEVMDLYKRENVSPFAGCLSSIVQILLLISIFYLVRNPLTYMKKIDSEVIDNYKKQIKLEQGENSISQTYPEISIVKYISNKNKNGEATKDDKQLYINMNFLGLNLSSIPQENYKDYKVYIIPVLYIISSIISIKLTSNITGTKKEEKKEENGEPDMANQMNKGMIWMMPIMAVSVSLIAPLGLALYWLINNILMILERIAINKFSKEEEQDV